MSIKSHNKAEIEEVSVIIARNVYGIDEPDIDYLPSARKAARELFDVGYRKVDDEELVDKIASYFEKEDNWTKLKSAWNISGKSVQLRDMLREAITK